MWGILEWKILVIFFWGKKRNRIGGKKRRERKHSRPRASVFLGHHTWKLWTKSQPAYIFQSEKLLENNPEHRFEIRATSLAASLFFHDHLRGCRNRVLRTCAQNGDVAAKEGWEASPLERGSSNVTKACIRAHAGRDGGE